MIVLDQPQRVADWVAAQVGHVAPSVDAAIGYERDGEIRAGVYFDNLTDTNIFCHIANSLPNMPIGLLQAVAAYTTLQLRLKRITFPVPANNRRVIRFVRRMGAVHEATLKEACGDQDMLIYMLWTNCAFVEQLLNTPRKTDGQ